MNKIKVINPLRGKDYFKLELNNLFDNELIIKTEEIINKNINLRNKLQKLINLIKKNNNNIVFNILLQIMSYNDWLEMFNECEILKNYWNEEILNNLLDNSTKRCLINEMNNLKNKTNIENKELINLKNNVNRYYNFTEDVFIKRKNTLNDKLNEYLNINLDDFYGDENVLFYLGYNKFYGKKINKINELNKEKLILTFFCKNNSKIQVKEKIENIFDINEYFVKFETDDFKINIFRYTCSSLQYLILNLKRNGFVDFESNNIYVNCLIYQVLEEDYFISKIKNYDLEENINNKIINYTKLTNIKISDKIIKNTYNYLKKCYICDNYFNKNLKFIGYNNHCLDCSKMCYLYKIEKTNLTNFTVLITGIRVKIGYFTTLRILRNGGNVIGTTRYPSLAVNNYSKEKDYEDWKNRLKIIKCDFTILESVNVFLDLIREEKINCFINMAFKTVSKTDYYENKINELEGNMTKNIYIENNNSNLDLIKINNKIGVHYLNLENIKINDNSKNSNNNDLINGKSEEDIDNFINNYKDVKDIDFKVKNSEWNKKLEDLERVNIVECMAINQLVPTLIIKELKPKLISPKFIIHVTSLEGQFNTNKTDKHPHTNMCKAAMNMLIKTLENDPDKNLNIYSIDPGYVSGISESDKEFSVSLEDSASRVTFPIFMFFNNKKVEKSIIKIRNYKNYSW